MEFKERNPKEGKEFCIVMDLGATNANLAVAALDNDCHIVFTTHFDSQKIKGIEEALNETLGIAKEKYDISVSKACIAAPGPVNADRTFAKGINLPYDVGMDEIKKQTMLREVILMNDFEAVAYGVDCLCNADIIVLKHGEINKGTRSVIGPGTGLGVSIAPYNSQKEMNIPLESEGGNTEVVVGNAEELEIVEKIKKQHNKTKILSYEWLVSGKGIVNLYDALKEKHGRVEEIEKTEQKAEAISKNESETCKKAMEYFVKFCARLAKNIALDSVSLGGVYIAGGIAAKDYEKFQSPTFVNEFKSHHNPKFAELLEKMPVYLVKNYDISLYGAIKALQKMPELAKNLRDS